MKIKSFSQATCAALVLALLCTAVPASAQMRPHGTPGCSPGNPHCQDGPTERGRSGRGNAGGNDGSNGWRNGERDMGHNSNGRMARQPMPAPMPMPPHGGMIERQGWPDQRPDARYVQPHDQGRRPWADRGLHRGDRVPQDERAKHMWWTTGRGTACAVRRVATTGCKTVATTCWSPSPPASSWSCYSAADCARQAPAPPGFRAGRAFLRGFTDKVLPKADYV